MEVEIIRQLRHQDAIMREKALHQVASERVSSEDVCIAVGEMLTDSKTQIRELAAETLLSLGCRAAVLKPMILSAVFDSSPIVREMLLRTLTLYSPDASIRDAGISLLEDPVLMVRIRAAQLVWHCSSEADLIQEVIRSGLQSSDKDCLIATCQLLAQLENWASKYCDELAALTRHKYGGIRANALFALVKCSSDASLIRSMAAVMVGDDDPAVRYIAHKAMKK